MSELMRDLGVGWGTIAYHVHALRRQGRVVLFSPGREARLFPAGVSNGEVVRISADRDPASAAILSCLAAHPGSRAAEIASRLARHPHTVRRQLNALQRLGLVQANGSYGRRYFLQEAQPTAIGTFLDAVSHEGQGAGRPRRGGQVNRDAILEAVRARPGIHASDLARAANVSWPNFWHHVRLLERAQALRRWPHGGRVHYFMPDVPRGEWPYLAAMTEQANGAIVRVLEAEPELAVDEIARRLGQEPEAVARRMARLADMGVVRGTGPLDDSSASSGALAAELRG